MLQDVVTNCIEKFNIDCALVIKNLKTGEECRINDKRVLPSASVIKIFIMGEILNEVNKGELSLEDKIVVHEKDKVSYSVLTLFDQGREFTLRELLTLMICQSENTATNVLINIAGFHRINDFMKSYGLNNCELQRKMMDFKARQEGKENYISAEETAEFLELLYNGKVINEHYSKIMIEIMKKQLHNADIHQYIMDDIPIAHKTGDIWGYKHDAGIFYLEKGDYIFTMLTNFKEDQFIHVGEFLGRMAGDVYNYFTQEP